MSDLNSPPPDSPPDDFIPGTDPPLSFPDSPDDVPPPPPPPPESSPKVPNAPPPSDSTLPKLLSPPPSPPPPPPPPPDKKSPPPSSPPPPDEKSPPPSPPPPPPTKSPPPSPPDAPPPEKESPPPPPPKESPPPPPEASPPAPSPPAPPPENNAPPPSPPADPPSPPPPPPENAPPPANAPPPTHHSPPPSHAPPPTHHSPPPASPPSINTTTTPPPAPPPSSLTATPPAPPPSLPATPPAPPPSLPATPPAPPPSLPATPPALPPSLPATPPAPPPSFPTTPPAQPPFPSLPTEKTTSKPTISNSNTTTAPLQKDAGATTNGGAIAVGLVGFLALSFIVFAVWFVQNRKKKRAPFKLGYMMPSPFASSQNSDSSFLRVPRALGSAHQSPYHSANLSASGSTNNFMYSGDHGGMASTRSWFTFEELTEVTDNFSTNNILGEGGFGCVYKGVLPDGREVAIKQLKSGGGQGEREFRAEVEIISRIHHRHLVSLVGYCIADHQRLLVYDFVSNDTLDFHLHGKERDAMTWATRFKVAAGAARGLAYLHEDCTPRVIHRDIKSANILLDDNFDAKVADFGLAKLASDLEGQTHVSTRVMGTFGYMAPEYATTGKLTEKSDVFSFGVVLLELITGHRPVDASRSFGDESLVEWARPLLARAIDQTNFDELVDSRLEKNFIESEMLRMIEAAAACVRHLASKRPKMSQVARALEATDEPSDLTNGMKPGQSQIFDTRQHSEQMKMFEKMAFGSQEYSRDFFNKSQSNWKSGGL